MNGAHHPIFTTHILGAFQCAGNRGASAHDAIQGVKSGDVGVRDIVANRGGCYNCRLLLGAEG